MATEANPSNPYKLSALLVDGDAADRRSIVTTLTQVADEVVVTECQNTQEAFDLLSERDFDFALVCQQLPDGLGTDLLQQLKESNKLNVPIILMTENDQSGEELIRLGAQEFLSKETLSVQQFKKSIRYSIERHKLWTDLMASRLREQKEYELRLLEASEEHNQQTTQAAVFEKELAAICTQYAKIFESFVQDNSYKRTPQAPVQIKELAMVLAKLHAGPKELVRIHRLFLNDITKDKTAKREESLTNEARYFLLQLMGELLVIYRDKSLPTD